MALGPEPSALKSAIHFFGGEKEEGGSATLFLRRLRADQLTGTGRSSAVGHGQCELHGDFCVSVMVVRQVWQHNGPWVMSGRLRCQGVDSGRVPGGGILTGLYP